LWSELAANVYHRAAALVGEDNANQTVMTDAFNHDPAIVGTDDIGAADAHVASLLHGAVRLADAAAAASTIIKPVTAATMAFKPVPAAAAIVITDDDAAAVATDRKFETDAAGSGGRSGSGDAGSCDNDGGECIADEGVHGCSPDLAAFHALSVCP
jgi:hypothetical protein